MALQRQKSLVIIGRYPPLPGAVNMTAPWLKGVVFITTPGKMRHPLDEKLKDYAQTVIMTTPSGWVRQPPLMKRGCVKDNAFGRIVTVTP